MPFRPFTSRFLFAIASLGCAACFAADDPRDKTERVLLLLPKAPLLVELSLTIDEQPFRLPSERALDDLLAQADADKDGKVTLEEAGKANGGLSAEQLAAVDANKNGLLDKDEARVALAQMFGGETFNVQGQAFLGGQADGSQLEQLLDTDQNGGLSDEEIDAAPERLRSRDADDNENVTAEEIAGVGNVQNIADNRALAPIETILAINANTNWQQVRDTLALRYGKKSKLPPEAFKHTRAFGKALDKNGDGDVSAEELAALATAEAPLVLDVALGTRTRLRDTVVVASMCDELKSIARVDRGGDGKLIIDLLTIRLDILAPNPKPMPSSFAGKAKSLMINYDKDGNQYLEKKEVSDPMYAGRFDTWDADRNGKVYENEIRMALERLDAPNWQKISIAALSLGGSLFNALDTNGDGQLGVREVREAADRLRTAEEGEQESMRIAIARGAETFQYLNKGVKRMNRRGGSAATFVAGPEWFQHMDTNGDGDVTLREFLGSAEQFQKLDANANGILEPGEADKAK
jgi:Ca2+-binding EF-hand superfamily protein